MKSVDLMLTFIVNVSNMKTQQQSTQQTQVQACQLPKYPAKTATSGTIQPFRVLSSLNTTWSALRQTYSFKF